MYAVGRLSSYISQGVYTVSAPFHPFGGAVDIIVVEQPDGSYKSSPWYVKFGKFQGVLKTKEKIVNVCINGVEADFHMYLDHKGEAFFLREVDGEEMDSTIFSPPSSGDETDEQSRVGRIEKSKSCDFEMQKTNLDNSIDFDRGKIMVRSNSRSRILGLMFGRKSVKGNNKQEEAGGIALESFNSLERAEIAADLLEVKWSTNLPSETPRSKASNLSANNVAAEGSDKGSQVNNNQGTGGSVENSFDHSAINEATVSCNEEMDKSSLSDIRDAKCSNGVNSPDRSIKPEEHDTDACVEASALDKKFEVISETSTRIDMLYIRNATLGNTEESETVIRSPSMQNSEIDKREGDSNSQREVERVSEERGLFSNAGVSFEERENLLMYCEPSENSGVEVDPNRQGLVTQNLSKEECKEPQVHAEDLCKTTEVIAELSSKPEFPALANENNPGDEDSDKFCNTYAALHFVESSAGEDARDVVLESHSMLDIELVTSESGEAKMSELIHRETIAAHFSEGKNLQREIIEVFENGSQGHGSSSPCITGSTELRLEELPKTSGSCAQIVSNDRVGSEEATDPQDLSSTSSCRKSISLDQEEEYLEEEEDMSNVHNSLGFVDDPQRLSSDYLSTSTVDLSKPPGESLGEDQFQFSDSDDFIISEVHHDDSAFVESLEMENDPSVTMSDIEDSTPSSSMDHRSHLSSIKLERSPNAVEALLEESTNKSSPISIPGSRKCAEEEVEWRIESLPIIRSDIDNLEISDVPHPLSHSLDSHSEQLRRELLQKDVSNCSTSDLDTKHQLAEDDPTIKDTRIWEEFKNMSLNNAVEISLCKHLLYEGMGADAASQAFDAEKVDSDNCASLGPQLVKNDNLVVRIGGRYFPWDAAATYVSEMLSLGHDQVSEPEGMIAVDRVEKTIEGEPSRPKAPSGGSWSLWPFSLRRSSTETSAQSVPNVTDNSNGLDASESTSEATGNNSSPTVSKLAKQKVKSIVPTSEQLATLNLKEGRNVITFTFSTAMLGKQEVDARVYLWKWNTRIVVSDVDGTITRSDVLGQFMPLVGKDWSHIGVTQLFSAIKENGYQLLFLSARAISQAHLTRQFLFNLKQDGKALPDGPVVISPDGLFPSLFREVIRRAPHEFKIACLQDIRALFPPDCSPFYAGFGNRITDEISYRKLGIPKGKIFIINPRGEVAVNRRFDRKSYTSLHALVDGMFPATTSAEQEDFNQWNYWRMPLPDINS